MITMNVHVWPTASRFSLSTSEVTVGFGWNVQKQESGNGRVATQAGETVLNRAEAGITSRPGREVMCVIEGERLLLTAKDVAQGGSRVGAGGFGQSGLDLAF